MREDKEIVDCQRIRPLRRVRNLPHGQEDVDQCIEIGETVNKGKHGRAT